jgi:hypothetical protein
MYTMDSQPLRWPQTFPILLALGLALASAGPVAASGPSSSPPSVSTSSAVRPLFASGGLSWQGFYKYWRHFANRADRVVVVVLGVMAAALFIITRGKWLK